MSESAFPPVSVAIPQGMQAPPPLIQEEPADSGSKTPNDACIKRMLNTGVGRSEKIYPTPTSPGTKGKAIEIQTNVYGIDVAKDTEIFQYSVSMKADLSPTKEVVFTKKGKEDYVVLDRHKKCCAILAYSVKRHEDFFQRNKNVLIYDGQSMLYSTSDLFEGRSEKDKKTMLFEVNGVQVMAERKNIDGLEKLTAIKVEVFPTKNPPVQFSKDNIRRRGADANIEAINNAYHQILELALNQASLQDSSRCIVFEHGKLFFLDPDHEGFLQADCTDVGDGKHMRPGIKKTVQYVEGHQGRGASNPSVVIDGMKVAFHKEQTVFEKLREITRFDPTSPLPEAERARCLAVMKGLDCFSKHTGANRHHTIEGIHHKSAMETRFENPTGGHISVVDHFKTRYNITLSHPNANLIVCKERGNLNYYPMESLTISPNQRVKISQLTSQQSQKTTKESAVLPDVRQRLIATGKEAARISSDSFVLENLGIRVTANPVMAQARQLLPVKVTVNNSAIPMKENKWSIRNFVRPGAAPKIWAMYAVGTEKSRFTAQQLSQFGEEFTKMCKQKGITLPPPADSGCVLAADILQKLNSAGNAKCELVFCITDDNITNLHQKYKMAENEHGMIVQDMKMSKAASVLTGKRLTLENVINKTNVKLGGSNHTFQDSKKMLEDTLVIGVGINQPPPAAGYSADKSGVINPNVVGYSYNGNKEQEFVGDFMLCTGGQDTLPVIDEVVKESLEGYKEQHNGRLPKTVIVYRSGVSEGNHGYVIAYEIPLARRALEDTKSNIKLVYIAVSKEHTFRFFRPDLHSIARSGAKPWDMNIPPGITIDTGVTNPAIKQFFLNSHITLQGSAKTPLYSILTDDTKASMDDLEELTFNLCHLHQIVGLPTSIPTPLYVANEYAKRGRNMFIEASADHPVYRQEGSERVHLKGLTEMINYGSRIFRFRRVNA